MHHDGKMLSVQDPIQFFQCGIQSNLFKRVVGCLDDWVIWEDFSSQKLTLQASQSGNSLNFAVTLKQQSNTLLK